MSKFQPDKASTVHDIASICTNIEIGRIDKGSYDINTLSHLAMAIYLRSIQWASLHFEHFKDRDAITDSDELTDDIERILQENQRSIL